MRVTERQPRTAWPVTAAEAASYIGLVLDAETSALLDLLIAEATEAVEKAAGRGTTARKLRLLVEPPADGVIAIPYPPVVVEAVSSLDEQWNATELSLDDFVIVENRMWPKAAWPICVALQVDYRSGYAAASAVPADLKLGVLRAVLQAWERRTLGPEPESLGGDWRVEQQWHRNRW